jgi:4-hydroxy-4-methyl-2-oxoglutarate aldolase
MDDARAPAGTPSTGSFRPSLLHHLDDDDTAPDPALLARLAELPGVSAAVSDELDRRGLSLAVGTSVLGPLHPGRTVVGRTITLRYLPARSTPLRILAGGEAMMAHRTLFELASPGDVALIVGPHGVPASLLGGEAAAMAQAHGVIACLLAGDVRDVDEILALDFPVWATGRTPATGRLRIEAAEINGPVEVGGVQVRAGDIAVADDSGAAFIPAELLAEIAHAILDQG